MILNFYKYQATGNDFIVIDDRQLLFDIRNNSLVQKLCHRRFGIGADGLILLRNDPTYDFKMIYFNSDGYEGSMCGNGGRCITAFANHLMPDKSFFKFIAIDGVHESSIDNINESGHLVRLQMNDVDNIISKDDDYILNTGSPHYVKLVDDNHHMNVVQEGRLVRNSEAFLMDGINVNFVEIHKDEINVRTYERGVEDETLSCGTGVTASAIAAYFSGKITNQKIKVHTPGGELSVSFSSEGDGVFRNIFLIGSANFVFQGKIDI
jgi:diaminopimelate epimerase